MDLPEPQAEPVVVTQNGPERDQVLGKARKRVHQEPGRETDPKPKSVLRL